MLLQYVEYVVVSYIITVTDVFMSCKTLSSSSHLKMKKEKKKKKIYIFT